MSLVIECPYCGDRMVENFREHVKEKHPDKVDRRGDIECPYCKSAYHYTNILSHFHSIHPSKIVPQPRIKKSQIEFYVGAINKANEKIEKLEQENKAMREKLNKIWHVMMRGKKEIDEAASMYKD